MATNVSYTTPRDTIRGCLQILVTWGNVKEQWSIVGGTGKYRGITGTGTTGKFDSLQDRPDGWTGIAHETISWRIR